MAKKGKKVKDAEKKARVIAKQSKKTAQKDKKVKSKGADDSDAEDIDLESVLEEYAKQVGNGPSKIFFDFRKALTILASPIAKSHGDSLRASISSLVSNSHWISFQCERAFSFWRRVLQWRSCYIF